MSNIISSDSDGADGPPPLTDSSTSSAAPNANQPVSEDDSDHTDGSDESDPVIDITNVPVLNFGQYNTMDY